MQAILLTSSLLIVVAMLATVVWLSATRVNQGEPGAEPAKDPA
jgi:hypothetical protein